MRIKKVEVRNYRALRNSEVEFGPATALIGENNCGKSAFLHAIDLFFAASPRIVVKDFTDENTAEPIDITIHFGDLTPYDLNEFDGNLLDGQLVVTRRFMIGGAAESGKYFVSARVNPDFSECRAESGKIEKRKLYDALREKYGNPPELEKVKSADEIDGHLEKWEASHPDKLEVQKVGSFKGWTNVAAGKLRQKTNYVLIPAVQDAEQDIQGSKTSPVKSLIDAIAKQAIENKAEFQAFMKEANERIAQLTDPANVPTLGEISSGLTRILAEYYKDSEIIATWEPVTQIQSPFPTANIEVKDNDFVADLSGVGHGLQRAVILTVLRFMADHRAKQEGSGEEFDAAQSDLIIAIEEPEIYQHPTKQRLFAKLLSQLTVGFSKATGIRIQTIFVTHCPLLVSLGNCEEIRMVRRKTVDDKRNVVVKGISLDVCSKRSAEISGMKPEDAWSAANFGARLHTFSVEMAEGFFARCVVLVEGPGDRAVIEAWYKLKERDYQAEGVVIVEVSGKGNLSRPALVFEELGIPCYVVFDNDKSSNKDKEKSILLNKMLQRLAGIDVEKCEEWPEGVFARLAVLDKNLEAFVRGKVGNEMFDKVAQEMATNHDIDPGMCLKFPASASGMLLKFTEAGHKFEELDQVLSNIDKLATA